MSHQDEDDEFFADIYKKEAEKPADPPTANTTTATSSVISQPPAPEPAGGAAPVSGDPRLALLSGMTSGGGQAGPVSTGAAAPAPQPVAVPQGVPTFDPAQITAQLQQLQALQQQGAGGASGPLQPHAADLKPAEQGGGFLAGKIFIPAKDEGKMFIGGLNWETTDESMKNYFSQFGEVSECTVMRDSATGRSRGFGFLTFKDPSKVAVVLSKEHFLDGKIIDPKRAIPREEQDKTAKIFVGGVGPDVTEEDFKEFFEQYGTVIDAQLMMDKDTGRPRGFGFVTFDSDQAVEKIVVEQFLELKGKPIEVKRAEPRGREQARDDGRNGRAAFAMPQQNFYGAGMDPAMMSQYYQQWQAYMQKMQEMMRQGGATNPMMQMYQQMMQTQAQGGAPPSTEDFQPHDRDHRRDRDRDRRRGNDDRRRSRSRSPGGETGGGSGRRRRGGRDRDRDRHYNRG